MTDIPFEKPVEDSVPRIHDEIAVGENINFQRRWWRFEKIIWPILLLIVIADMLGVFGRGWLAKAHAATPDHALTVDYERVARASTPSIMTFKFGPAAIHNNRIVLFVSDSIVKPLGAQRISPEPALSIIGKDGITYVFASSDSPAGAQVELQPSLPGPHKFRVQVLGGDAINGSIFVMP